MGRKLQNVGSVIGLLTICIGLLGCGSGARCYLLPERSKVELLAEYNLDVDHRCAGTKLGTDLVLTAAHCVYGCMAGDAKFAVYDGTATYVTGLVACVRDFDVAVLRSSVTWPKSPVVVARKAPRLGEGLWIIGNPAGMGDDTVSHGTLANTKGLYYAVDGSSWFGNSGGGVYNSSFELVGLMSHLPGMPHPDGDSVVPGLWAYAAGLASIRYVLDLAEDVPNGP